MCRQSFVVHSKAYLNKSESKDVVFGDCKEAKFEHIPKEKNKKTKTFGD
jgi:hypothetical protein